MILSERLERLAFVAEKEFRDLLKDLPNVFSDRVQLIFSDNSIMTIRYPLDNKYSFHWQRGTDVYRINTAPYHKNIPSFPRHMHEKTENNVVEDLITDFKNTPEQNLKNVLNWVREKLRE